MGRIQSYGAEYHNDKHWDSVTGGSGLQTLYDRLGRVWPPRVNTAVLGQGYE
eukprot:jgi/Psemu1/5081/gm1.5081_g